MPTPIDKPFIRHINEDTLDNRPENLTFTASTENSDAILFTKSAQWRMLFASRIIEPEQRQRALDAITSDPHSLAESAQARMLFASSVFEPEQPQPLDATTSDECSHAECKCLYVARDLPNGGPEFMHRDVALGRFEYFPEPSGEFE